MPTVELDSFTRAYVEAALWSSTDNADDSGGEPLDANHSVDDIAPETLAAMVEDCASFQRMFGAYIVGREVRAGQDFWLTRCGHGAGFWDGDWEQPYVHDIQPDEPEWHAPIGPYETVGDYLTAMSKPYGDYDLYIGDDGLIHGR